MLTWDSIVEFGKTLPGVEESTWDGTPALKVKGRVFTHLRPHDEVLVLVCTPGEKAAQLSSGDPAMFTEPQYAGYGAILIHLEQYDFINDLEELLTEGWRVTLEQTKVNSPYDDASDIITE